MAINAYCGVMGSGKSYEVVSGPLLDAVAAGRRVVTNIDGVNEDRIHDYLCRERNLDESRLGRVVHVTTARIAEPGFFPVEHEGASGTVAAVTPGFVEPGDFVVVDEAWKLWSQDVGKLSEEHMSFFRMHRHFVHPETGVACDVALMIQDISDLHRKVKNVVELSFRMVKLKSVGLAAKYRVEMYEGWRQTAKARTGTFLRTYKREIFPLYKSYAGEAGKESQVDRRQNVLANRTLWALGALLAVVTVIGGWSGWRFFHPPRKAAMSVANDASSSSHRPSSPASTPAVPKRSLSEQWRIAGRFMSAGVVWVMLVDGNGRLRPASPASFAGSGVALAGELDGDQVTTYSGPTPSVPLADLGAHK
jgi:zona occludens toxin